MMLALVPLILKKAWSSLSNHYLRIIWWG